MSAEHDQLMLPQLPPSLTWGCILLPEARWYMWTNPAQARNRWEMQAATPSQGRAIIIAHYLSVAAQLKFTMVSEVSTVPLLSVWIPNLADTQLNIPRTVHRNQFSFYLWESVYRNWSWRSSRPHTWQTKHQKPSPSSPAAWDGAFFPSSQGAVSACGQDTVPEQRLKSL